VCSGTSLAVHYQVLYVFDAPTGLWRDAVTAGSSADHPFPSEGNPFCTCEPPHGSSRSSGGVNFKAHSANDLANKAKSFQPPQNLGRQVQLKVGTHAGDGCVFDVYVLLQVIYRVLQAADMPQHSLRIIPVMESQPSILQKRLGFPPSAIVQADGAPIYLPFAQCHKGRRECSSGRMQRRQ
jgi:hypothetical protein